MLPFNFLPLLSFAFAARCDPNDVRACLATFEVQFLSCDANDLACQCGLVLSQGSVCFDGCPEEALDEFVSTYADGVCRKAEAHALDDDYGYFPQEMQLSQDEHLGANQGESQHESEHNTGKSHPEEKQKKNSWWSRIKGNNNPYVAEKQQSKPHPAESFSIQTAPNPTGAQSHDYKISTAFVSGLADQELNKAVVSHSDLQDVKAKSSANTASAIAKINATASAAHEPSSVQLDKAASTVANSIHQTSSTSVYQHVPSVDDKLAASAPAHQVSNVQNVAEQQNSVASALKSDTQSHQSLVDNHPVSNKATTSLAKNLTSAIAAVKESQAEPFSQKALHLGSEVVEGARKNSTTSHTSAVSTKQTDLSPFQEIKVTLIAAGIAMLAAIVL